ncbi:MAG: glycoside hydrolase, partial [Verrucomicrobiota bacterium]
NYEYILSRRPEKEDYGKVWGDLIMMFRALNDPASSAAYIDANPECTIEVGNSHAFMYHWIHTFERLGLNDVEVTSDYPFVNVYNKAGKRTYAAYNFRSVPISVTFSDGTEMSVAPRGLTVVGGSDSVKP